MSCGETAAKIVKQSDWQQGMFGGVHMVFRPNGVDFTRVGQLHTECVCTWGGLT